MAASALLQTESVFGNKRIKIYKITHDGSDTSISITPGAGYGSPIGPYTAVTVSSGIWSFTISAGTNGANSYIQFVSD